MTDRENTPSGDGSPSRGTDLGDAFALVAESTRQFADSMDIEATLAHTLELIVEQLGAEAGSLWLLDEAGATLTCRASAGPNKITGLSLPVTKGIIGKSVRANACEMVRDVSKDPNFAAAVDEQSGFVTHSLLCAPMAVSDEPIGAIELVNKKGADRFFGEADVYPLRVLASSAALAIANARMASRLVDQERVRRELELAAEIQRTLLPPADENLPVYGINIPAREVSGDFYDYLVLPDGRIAFCVGDVSGKGMNAAILMAKTASLYRCLSKTVDRPGELLSKLNDEICETATRGMFVTMAAGLLDPATGIVWLSNAGHEPALWYAGGRFAQVPADAPPLGIAPGIVEGGAFPENDFDLEGGSLYLFSDGLTEAAKEDGEQLGAEGFMELVSRFAKRPLGKRVEALVANVARLKLRDDLTLLALQDPRSVAETPADTEERLLTLEIPARPNKLRMIRDAVRECATESGAGEECCADIVMAIDEACQNIIRHAYQGDPDGTIRLEIDRLGDDLVFSLHDDAPTVDPAKVKPRDLDDVRPGGLGTHFIRRVMDETRFIPPRSGRGNLLRMVKRIG